MVQLVLILGFFTVLLQKAGKADSTEKLIEDLRLQLMRNNYDYMERSGESEQLTTQALEELPVIRARDMDMSGYLHEEYPIRRADPIDDDVSTGSQQVLQRLDKPSSKRHNFEVRFEPTSDVSHRDRSEDDKPSSKLPSRSNFEVRFEPTSDVSHRDRSEDDKPSSKLPSRSNFEVRFEPTSDVSHRDRSEDDKPSSKLPSRSNFEVRSEPTRDVSHRDRSEDDKPSSKLPSRRNFKVRSEPTSDVSHRDLHYYMDDDHLSNNRRMLNKFDITATGGGETTVQYKVLEIRGHLRPKSKSGRRNGQFGSRRRFLQEERPDHIAIMPLDEGPIPEFRLPRNRRQYMGDYEGSEEKFPTLPPLPGIMGLPDHDPTPVAKRRYRPPEPDSRSSTSAEIDPTRNRLRNSLEDELVYITQ